LDDILNSGANFARKFEGEDGIALINAIKDKIHGKKLLVSAKTIGR
jgi:hypothetical protein